jgi:hypothetical protein
MIRKSGYRFSEKMAFEIAWHTILEDPMSRAALMAIAALIVGACDARAETGNGTPQEREACSRDASRLCRKQMADGDNAVQQCLQQNRERLGRACRKVFQDHGM